VRERDKAIVAAMEKFVLVGILYAHVAVACRPTMPEALRILEGHVDVPELPDGRWQPYGQRIPSVKDEGNVSGWGPVCTRPCLGWRWLRLTSSVDTIAGGEEGLCHVTC
jgi:hypothetical protein